MRRYDQHFDLAHKLNKQLHEIMGWPGPMTRRQFWAWRSWLNEQWNEPSRSDYYLMHIAYEVAHVLAKKRGDFEKFKLKFKTTKRRGGSSKPKQDARTQKAYWLGAFGGAKGIRGLPENWIETELPPHDKDVKTNLNNRLSKNEDG